MPTGAVLPQIDRYEISHEIGHGGMATVYRARDTRLDRWVAVKVMHPHLRGAAQARVRFSREARAVARLKHPSILEIYDYSGNDSENAYIATELLTGPTLKGFVEQVGEVPPEIAACVCVDLSHGLSAAHAESIVHRDVKPENVLLHENRVVKLTDFGIADMLDPSMSAMTATGQILGSPAHMAPEQVEGGETDARSDIFALGTILYWLSTGELPFSGKNPHQVLKRVVDCQPPDPLVLRPAIGRELRDIIVRCLAKAPADRYQRADDLAQDLCAWLRTLGIEDSHAALEAYLKDPKGEGERLRAQVVDSLLAHAREAVSARQRLRALPMLDRVLALADGHPEALRLLGVLDRATRRKLWLRAVAGGLAVAAVAGLWALYAPKTDAVLSSGEARAQQLAAAPVSEPAAPELSASSKPRRPEVAREQKLASESARNSSPPAQVRATPEASEEPRRVLRPAPRERAATASARGSSPRTVVFDPKPANVSISVDGAAPKHFGPAFRMVELPPGPHTFRFIGAHDCCEDEIVELELPSGPGETVVSPDLAFRPARVYVVSDIPADVSIDGEPVGRTRSLINVPVDRRYIERRKISVTAPGHEAYTGSVQLRAGQVTQLDVELKPSEAR